MQCKAKINIGDSNQILKLCNNTCTPLKQPWLPYILARMRSKPIVSNNEIKMLQMLPVMVHRIHLLSNVK
jgi:hypothetical protein